MFISIHSLQSISLSKTINCVLITEQELLQDELSINAKNVNALLNDNKPVPDELWVIFVGLMFSRMF